MKKVLFFFLFIVFTAGSIFAFETRDVNLSIIAGTKSDSADWTIYYDTDGNKPICEARMGGVTGSLSITTGFMPIPRIMRTR